MRSNKAQLVQPLPPQSKWWAMLGIGLGVLMFTLGVSIINIAHEQRKTDNPQRS